MMQVHSPMAIIPTTTEVMRILNRFCPVRKFLLEKLKMMHSTIRTPIVSRGWI